MWEDAHVRLLVDERKNRNDEFHLIRKKKAPFWNSVAEKINNKFNTTYTGKQCTEKFSQLVREFNLMVLYRSEDGGKSTHYGQIYFDEFRTHFWLRSSDQYNYEHNLNKSKHYLKQQLIPPTTLSLQHHAVLSQYTITSSSQQQGMPSSQHTNVSHSQ
ncbi:15403_t:CDS:2 [Cetraspora pellucida]|uniref:15403_t:CDS:1 n=1 Tax=Cetraspora pellucida TaxID=1433469 RepID=A0A9N9NF01_9GLOM|nr:15403_t:CDS:2 [Cetraspora pellucida]